MNVDTGSPKKWSQLRLLGISIYIIFMAFKLLLKNLLGNIYFSPLSHILLREIIVYLVWNYSLLRGKIISCHACLGV